MSPAGLRGGRERALTAALSVAIAVGLVSCAPADSTGTTTSNVPLPAPRQTSATPSETTAAPVQTPSQPAAGREDYRDPARVDVVVNKHRPVKPLDFTPSSLTLPQVPLATSPAAARLKPDAARALEKMFAAAAANGIGLTMVSGYRSYQDQSATYLHWVAVHGSTQGADAVSARPGYSEHQLGLAFDVGQADGTCTLLPCFRDTAAGQWMDEHAHRFGFILRYPAGSEKVTGFHAEYWHFRYVGLDISADMHTRGIPTLEEYLGLPAAPDYL